ncbi:MAG: NF038122 family metalloprotease [Acidobacteriota bacterium]
MHRLCAHRRALTLIPVLIVMIFPSTRKTSALLEGSLTQDYALGVFARKAINGRMVCLEAGIEQARSIRDRNATLTRLTPDPVLRRGLKIILRGTSQLQNFPAALEAFKRAAAQWEAQIQTVVFVVIDVDFGPTLFGKQFDDDVVSVSDAQVLGGNAFYPAVRADLISGPYSLGKRAFYNSLPADTVPTDAGATSGLMATTATLRALDLIAPVADPDSESNDFGPPPAIGFNSKFRFDFDLSDGIDNDKLDFEAMALHEIGHALGLISSVGQKEMNPSIEVAPSMWDLFRIRPDASNDFSAAERILSSGGEQSFYTGGAKLALSTGRPDGASGDGRHASHWKDDNLAGQYLGAMDPTIGMGEHQYLTDSDVSALDALGYRTKSLLDPTTVVSLIPGQPQAGGMFAPPPGLGVLSHVQYSISSPPDAVELRIDLSGNQNVDLYVRYGRAVVNQGHFPVADYKVSTDSNSETLVITSESSPPLSDGLYYIAVANFGPGDADFTVTAQASGGRADHAPAILNIRSLIRGDALEIDCAATDREGDFAMAEVSLLDAEGRAVGPLSSFAIASGNSMLIESRFTIDQLSDMAQQAAVVLADRTGNRSARVRIDFGRPDAGGLTLTGASFTGSKLKLKARGIAIDLELEINGQIVAPPLRIKANGSGSKLTIKGNRDQLALRQGANRVRVKNVNGWSNIFILTIE